jgi:hypothetical protein
MARTPQQQPANPPAADPDHIPETLCTGRFYLTWSGRLATLTMTHVRPDAAAMFDSGTINDHTIVRARIVTTFENMVELRNLLNRSIKDEEGGPETTAAAGSSVRH